MKSTKQEQKTTKVLAANTNYGYKIALLKHNDNQTYTSEFNKKTKKKKKKKTTNRPIFFCFFFFGGGARGSACYSKHNFFFRL